MSASRPSPSNPKRPVTNQPSPSAVYTPKSAQAAGTPTPNPSDSPERAAKRARFDQAPNGATGRVAPATLGQIGRSKSNGRGGAVWVKEKVKELEAVYKDCVIAATLYLQYMAYAKKMGLGARRTPKHLSQRLEKSWMKYQSLRSHIEAYLLQCAQSASSAAKSLPTPSALVPGLPPLPPIPSIPNIASTILRANPHRPGDTSISLDKLAAADPKKGLIGYENGQIVFPGVPSDIAVPDVEDLVIDLELDTASVKVEDITLSKPLSGIVPTIDFSNMSAGEGEDITNMGIAELTALINGDDFMASAGMGVGDLDGSDQQNIGNTNQQGLSPNTQAATEQLLESLGQYTSAPPSGLSPFSAQPMGQVPQQQPHQQQQQQPPRRSPAQTAQAVEQMLASMAQTQPMPQTLSSPAQPIPIPPLAPVTTQQFPSQVQATQQQQEPLQPVNPPDFSFGYSNAGNLDTMDGLDPLADIDFDELAGLFGDASGRSTRVSSPVPGVITEMTTTKPAPTFPTQPTNVPIQPAVNPPVDQLGMDLTSLYPSESQTLAFQPVQSTQGFDDALEGINLDDFDFGDGNMPGVDGYEFESMFAEFK